MFFIAVGQGYAIRWYKKIKVCMWEGTPCLIKIERCLVCFLSVGLLKVLNVQLYSVNL